MDCLSPRVPISMLLGSFRVASKQQGERPG